MENRKPWLIYIAGPFRAATQWRVEQHVRDAEQAMVAIGKIGQALGVTLMGVCVHSMYRHVGDELPIDTLLDGDLELMRRCDAVLMVGKWQKSAGASAECERAIELFLPVFRSLNQLRDTLKAHLTLERKAI